MKKKNLLVLISALVLSVLITSCSTPSTQMGREPSQVNLETSIDWGRFTPTEYMPPLGKYSGQKVEINRRRRLVFLTPEEKKLIGIPENQLAFANYRHAQVFYIATIPGIYVDASNGLTKMDPIIEKVILSEKHWSAKIKKELSSVEAHSEMGFFLKPGYEITLLVNQDQKKKLPHPRILKESVVYSIESVRSEQEPNADFFPGALGPNFAIAFRVVSNTERNIQHLEDPDRIIISNKLDFSKSKSQVKNASGSKEALFWNALNTSAKNKRSQAYEVTMNNCTNGLFHLLDESLKYNKPINTEIIRQGALKFNKKELPKIIDYLRAQQAKGSENSIYMGPEVDALIQELIQYNEGKIKELKISENFMLSIPAFIGPHLKARGLIK